MSITFTCDDIFPSGCVLFTGTLPNFIDEDTIPCDPLLDVFLEKVTDKIEEILDDIDLTGLDKKCLTFNPATVTIKALHQEQIDLLCDHETRITDLEDSIENLDVSSKTIEVDLGCLSDLASPCSEGENLYTLLSIVRVLKSEICSLKEQLAECADGGCGSSSCTSGTSGITISGANGTSGSSGTSAVSPATSGVSGTSGTDGTSGCVEP